MSIANEITRLQTAKANLKTAIMAKGVEVADTDTIDTYASKVEAIESGGGIDLVSYANTLTFSNSVSEITEDIVLHCESFLGLNNMFDLITINAPKVTVYVSEKCTSFFRFIGRSSGTLRELEIIGNTKNVTNFQQMSDNRTTLERIVGEIDFSSATNVRYMLNSCIALKHFTPKANTIKVSISFSSSPNLTDETIQSIINGLADLTGATAQTITFHADVKAKLTDEQIATITNKNWTLA